VGRRRHGARAGPLAWTSEAGEPCCVTYGPGPLWRTLHAPSRRRR
jgi:hypothetical protein